MDDGSMWKKEISFRRKPKESPDAKETAPAAEPDAEAASVWKKELSFKRTPKDAREDQDAPPEADAKPASVWKKELSFGRKAKKAAEPEVHEPEALVEPEAKPASVWKKELSLGRKAKKAADDAKSERPKQSMWKKEISFGRKRDRAADVEADVDFEPVVAEASPGGPSETLAAPTAAEPAPETEPAPEPEPDRAPEAAGMPTIEPQPVAPEPVEGVEAEADSTPTLEAVPEPGPALEAVPEPTPFLEAVPTPEATPFIEAVPDPVELAAVPELVGEHSGVPDPNDVEVGAWTDTPELPPAPLSADLSAEPEAAAAEPVEGQPAPMPATVVHPPVPAAELPPVAEQPEKGVPFWKREISLGSRSKSESEKGDERAPRGRQKAAKPKKEKKARTPRVKAERGARGGKKLVGLKVGASQLAAARVSNNGSAELLQVAREPLSPGIVVGGELRDPDALAVALKDFFSKNKLPKRGVRLGIANNRIGVRTLELGGIDDLKQLDNAIRFRAQEALPIPIDEAVLDYQVLGESTDEQGQVVRKILLVVAYREQIDRYVDACRKAGITLVGIDLEAFALLRALQAPIEKVPEEASALVGVAIGHERSTFAVSDGRVCEFTRVLEWGGSALNVALARALDAAPSEVEQVKRALSLVDESVPEGIDVDQAAKARDAVRRAVQSFARELVSSLQFYQNQPGSLGIGEIVLTGGTAHLPGLAVELERMIGVHVRVGDPLARIKVSKKLGEPEQIGSYAVAIGLGIED